MKKYFISTAIDYVNAYPHIGHALEKVQADVIARYQRMRGNQVFFLSGTDENSLKNVKSAQEKNTEVKKLVDLNAEKFKQLKDALNLSFDDFIRTTEERHFKGAKKLWEACSKDIYKKKYKGLYCVGCEAFLKESELDENGLCPEHKTRPELIEEENYFFKLSKYQDKLKNLIEEDKILIIPQSRKKEVLKFIDSGLLDFCISRTSQRAQGWGIDVPNDPDQKMWVWFDALSNYINALGYPYGSENFKEFWQDNSNKVHVIGKGILRFHAIYWPAMLLSAGIELPNVIFAHGYLTIDGEKISKSLGNVIDPFELTEKYGPDSVRYFLLREIIATGDGDFSYEKLEKRHNSDLASGLGNLLSRTIAMAEKMEMVFSKKEVSSDFSDKIEDIFRLYYKSMDSFKFNEALASVWELIAYCDKYIEEQQPWVLLKQKDENLKKIFSNLLFALYCISQMLSPFMPKTSEKMVSQLGFKEDVFTPCKQKPLFPRL